MKIEYDPNKNSTNIEKHGLSFDLTYDFDFHYVLETEQIVNGELRYFVLGMINERLHALVY